MDLAIALSSRGDSTLIELCGVLDHASVPYLRQVTLSLFDQDRRHLIYDMSGLRLLDATSVKVLLYLATRAEELEVTVQVTGAVGAVLDVLELAGVAKQLGVHDELSWPLRARQREPVELDKLQLAYRFWPAGLAELFVRLHRTALDDPRRAPQRKHIIEQCLPASERLARRFAGSGEPSVDLTQVAALGLIKAVDGFNPGRGSTAISPRSRSPRRSDCPRCMCPGCCASRSASSNGAFSKPDSVCRLRSCPSPLAR